MGKKEKVIAHGNVARQINKNLRRERIFNIAKNQIAENGLEAFTIAKLAQEAGVSTPTIHNLFGKKSDIIKEFVSNLIELMKGATVNPPIEPIENAKFVIDNLVASIEKDKDFFRAALMSMDQLRLLDPRIPDGLFQRARQVAAPRKEWYETGLLLGNIEPGTIMKKVHNTNRLARIDWINGYIDLNQFRHQVLEGVLLAYASDASPELHVRLIEEINGLSKL